MLATTDTKELCAWVSQPHRDKTMIECSGQPRPTTASLERHVPRPGARPRRRVVRTLVCLMSHRAAWMLLPAWQSPSPPHPRLPAVAPDARRLARVLVRARDMLERVSARCLAPTSSGVAVCGRAAGERPPLRSARALTNALTRCSPVRPQFRRITVRGCGAVDEMPKYTGELGARSRVPSPYSMRAGTPAQAAVGTLSRPAGR